MFGGVEPEKRRSVGEPPASLDFAGTNMSHLGGAPSKNMDLAPLDLTGLRLRARTALGENDLALAPIGRALGG